MDRHLNQKAKDLISKMFISTINL